MQNWRDNFEYEWEQNHCIILSSICFPKIEIENCMEKVSLVLYIKKETFWHFQNNVSDGIAREEEDGTGEDRRAHFSSIFKGWGGQ